MISKNSNHQITTIAGNGERGKSGEDSDNILSLATSAALGGVGDIAIHPISGDLYFSELQTNKICKISFPPHSDDHGLMISRVAGGNFVSGFGGDGGLALNAEFNHPIALAIHPKTGDIYVSDYSNHRIRKISLTYGTISTVAGNGIPGCRGDGGLALFAQLTFPIAVEIHPICGDVYVVDKFNNKIRKIVASNGTISTIAGTGIAGFSGDGGLAINAQFNGPTDIAIHPKTGDIYVADCSNHRIRKILASNGTISTIAGTGVAGFSGDDGLAINAQFNGPSEIVICRKSLDIYIVDRNNHCIRMISSEDDRIRTIAGTGYPGFSGDGSLATNAQLHSPSGIAINHENGDLYISDYGNNRIRRVRGKRHDELKPPSLKLKKYDRDVINTTTTNNGMNVTCCRNVFKALAPSFYENVIYNNSIKLNSTQMEIVQHLIDSILYRQYHDEMWIEKYDLIDILQVLGMSSDFFYLKQQLIDKFKKYYQQFSDITTCSLLLEKVANAKANTPTTLNNLDQKPLLVDQLFDYLIGQAASIMKKTSNAADDPIFQKYLTLIVKQLSTPFTSDIVISKEEPTASFRTVESLFNDKQSSDIIVKLGSKEFHCHKTILASNSSFYEALLNSGFEYQDLKDNIYEINDTEEFGEELHEIILKYCYGIFDGTSTPTMIEPPLPLLQCSEFYGVKEMTDHYLKNIRITVENYCSLVEQFAHVNENFYEELIKFGVNHIHLLFKDREILSKLPSDVKDEICFRKYN